MLCGRCHLIRVLLAGLFVLVTAAILYHSQQPQQHNVIHLQPGSIAETSMSVEELKALSRANETCPVCFGRDACKELLQDVQKNVLKVTRKSLLNDPTQHEVYRKGKVRFWMRTRLLDPQQALLNGFEHYLCRKAYTGDAKNLDVAMKNCDVTVAAQSALYSTPLDVPSMRNLYKAHLVSRRRIPITICPTWRLVQGLVQAFDDNDDQTLTAEEKAVLITTLSTNPEVAVHKFVINQKVQLPLLPYFGACGRLTFVQGPTRPLSSFIKDSLPIRVNLASQVLGLIDTFLHDDPNWMLFTRDLNYDHFVVTDANQVFLKDLSNVLIVDKDMFNENVDTDRKCGDACFDQFYESLVDIGDHDNESNGHYKQCSQIQDMANHMYSLVCKMVLSDLPEDAVYRRTNPLAKSYPGLLHSLEEKVEQEKPLFQDVSLIKHLLAKCSRDESLETQQGAALQLMEELLGDLGEDEEQLGHDAYAEVQSGPADGDQHENAELEPKEDLEEEEEEDDDDDDH